MAMIRTFISIDLPENIKRNISDLQNRLKVLGGRVGWVRPEAIHLTLKFLGDIDEKKIPEIEAATRKAGKEFNPFHIQILGLGVFPNFKKPRIIWLGVNEGGDNLIRLQSKIEDEIEKIGYPREERNFKPHLTIGRVKETHGLKQLIDTIDAEREIDLDGFDATEVLIMKSELRPDGAIYTRLCEIAFN